MIDLDKEWQDYEEPDRPDLVPIFLGLFLLVLAFFILLVSISTFEQVKSDAVMDSLTSTFTAVLPPTTDPVEFNAKDGDILAGEAFQQQITTTFSTAIQVEQVDVVQAGRLMRLQLRTNQLFVADAVEVREDVLPVVDRIIAVLSNRPPGLRQDMEIIIGSSTAEGGALPVSETLEMQRVGSLAATFVSRGAPPDSVAIGLKQGNPLEISFWFWVRSQQETAIRFRDALEAAQQREDLQIEEIAPEPEQAAPAPGDAAPAPAEAAQ